MSRFRFTLVVAAACLVFGTVQAADPAYEIVAASGTLAKSDMGKAVAFVPEQDGKPGKQVTLAVTPDTVFLETTATTKGGKTTVAAKPIKAADLRAGAKEPVAVIYARVGDANHLLALATTAGGKLPKGFVIDATRGVLNKLDATTITMQPLIDGRFGKQTEVAVLGGSKFFEMSPKDDAKQPYTLKAAKVTDVTPKRQAISVLFARVGDEPSLLALVAQPGKDGKE